jgi:hypothetical protein
MPPDERPGFDDPKAMARGVFWGAIISYALWVGIIVALIALARWWSHG